MSVITNDTDSVWDGTTSNILRTQLYIFFI